MSALDKFHKIRKQMAEARADEAHPVEIEEDHREKAIDALLSRGALMGIDKLVAPEAVDTRPQDHVVVSGELHRTIYIHTFPPQVDDAWLSNLWRFEHPIDTAIYIQPLPIKDWLKRERTRLSHNEAAVRKEIEDGMNVPNPKRRRQIVDMVELIDAVEQDLTRPYQVLIASTARAETKKELDDITEILEDRISIATTRRALFKQRYGFETTLPFATNRLAATAGLDAVRFLHTQGVQTLFPFVNSVITHETGAMIGQSMYTYEPIIINRFLQPPYGTVQSPNAAIIGMTGSGKSYLAKLEMLRWLYQGVPVYVVDPTPGGEYKNVALGVGGQNIRISIDSPDHVNPLDFSYAVPRLKPGENPAGAANALALKIPFLVELLQVMLTEAGGAGILDPVTAKIFTNAALECYKRYGYSKSDVRTQLSATPEAMPTLGEVYVMLDRMRRASRDQLFQSKITPLVAALENFVGEGQYAGLYDHRSNVDLADNTLTVFHVGDVSDRHLPIVMHMVLEFLRTTLFTSAQLESGQRRILYVDECQRMLQFTETAYFLSWIASTCRKYGIGLTVMTQQIGQFLWNTGGSENKIGRSVLGACSLTLLLRQHSNEIENVRDAFKLTESELMRLRTVPTGQGLLLLDQDSCWFTAEYLATDEERRFLSTTAAERATFSGSDSEMLELPAGQENEDYESESGGGFFRPLGPGA